MARTPMVTRTIQTTKVTVMCLNVKEGKPFNKEITLPRVHKDEKAILKQVRKLIDNDEQKAVHIVSTETVETLYGMTEAAFIEAAEVLPPRKAAEQD